MTMTIHFVHKVFLFPFFQGQKLGFTDIVKYDLMGSYTRAWLLMIDSSVSKLRKLCVDINFSRTFFSYGFKY